VGAQVQCRAVADVDLRGPAEIAGRSDVQRPAADVDGADLVGGVLQRHGGVQVVVRHVAVDPRQGVAAADDQLVPAHVQLGVDVSAAPSGDVGAVSVAGDVALPFHAVVAAAGALADHGGDALVGQLQVVQADLQVGAALLHDEAVSVGDGDGACLADGDVGGVDVVEGDLCGLVVGADADAAALDLDPPGAAGVDGVDVQPAAVELPGRSVDVDQGSCVEGVRFEGRPAVVDVQRLARQAPGDAHLAGAVHVAPADAGEVGRPAGEAEVAVAFQGELPGTREGGPVDGQRQAVRGVQGKASANGLLRDAHAAVERDAAVAHAGLVDRRQALVQIGGVGAAADGEAAGGVGVEAHVDLPADAAVLVDLVLAGGHGAGVDDGGLVQDGAVVNLHVSGAGGVVEGRAAAGDLQGPAGLEGDGVAALGGVQQQPPAVGDQHGWRTGQGVVGGGLQRAPADQDRAASQAAFGPPAVAVDQERPVAGDLAVDGQRRRLVLDGVVEQAGLLAGRQRDRAAVCSASVVDAQGPGVKGEFALAAAGAVDVQGGVDGDRPAGGVGAQCVHVVQVDPLGGVVDRPVAGVAAVVCVEVDAVVALPPHADAHRPVAEDPGFELGGLVLLADCQAAIAGSIDRARDGRAGAVLAAHEVDGAARVDPLAEEDALHVDVGAGLDRFPDVQGSVGADVDGPVAQGLLAVDVGIPVLADVQDAGEAAVVAVQADVLAVPVPAVVADRHRAGADDVLPEIRGLVELLLRQADRPGGVDGAGDGDAPLDPVLAAVGHGHLPAGVLARAQDPVHGDRLGVRLGSAQTQSADKNACRFIFLLLFRPGYRFVKSPIPWRNASHVQSIIIPPLPGLSRHFEGPIPTFPGGRGGPRRPGRRRGRRCG